MKCFSISLYLLPFTINSKPLNKLVIFVILKCGQNLLKLLGQDVAYFISQLIDGTSLPLNTGCVDMVSYLCYACITHLLRSENSSNLSGIPFLCWIWSVFFYFVFHSDIHFYCLVALIVMVRSVCSLIKHCCLQMISKTVAFCFLFTKSYLATVSFVFLFVIRIFYFQSKLKPWLLVPKWDFLYNNT